MDYVNLWCPGPQSLPQIGTCKPLSIGFTDEVQCQRHIHVYHFVYLRPTQGALEFSVGVAFRAPGGGAC